jgi:hypothetical protein
MKLTQLIVRFGVGALLLVGATGSSRAAGGPAGQLCFVRAEDHGLKSQHPLSVWGEHEGKSRKLVELKRQKKACVSVPLGQWTLDARSTTPGAPKSSDPNACRSSPLVVEVTKEPVVPIAISPLGGGPANMCGWDLR